MQLKTILNAIEKYKSFVYSEARWSKSQNGREIEFEVQPRSRAAKGVRNRLFVSLWAAKGVRNRLFVSLDVLSAGW